MSRDRSTFRTALGIVLVACLCLVGSAAADWIVTTDGERIETRGPWTVDGRLIQLTLKNGELASMRVSSVDLEASRRLTESAAASAEEGETPPKKTTAEPPRRAKISLTDKDFTTIRRPRYTEGSEATEAEGETGEEASGEATALAVIASEDAQDPEGGTVLSGILANRSRNAVANVTLTVRLFDVEDQLLAETVAELSSPSLSPNGRASFRARFPGVLAFARVEYDPRSVELLTGESGESAGTDIPEPSDASEGEDQVR